MSSTEITPSPDRTRLENPHWVMTESIFRLDLSWSSSSSRWLEFRLDPLAADAPHRWRLLLIEAADDCSEASHEILATDVADPGVLMLDIEGDPLRYDRPPVQENR